jgi:prepilin-type N-terminal cleavage/methylation domain-containing protein
MKRGLFESIRRSQQGFTLTELLVGIALTSLLIGGVATAIPQMNSAVKRGNNHTYVATQLQNAAHWLQVDSKMAQEVTPDEGETGFPLVLRWVDWDNSEHEVTYYLSGNEFFRSYSVDGGTAQVKSLAQSVSSGTCSYQNGTLTVSLTSEEGYGKEKASQVRTISVKPRTQ